MTNKTNEFIAYGRDLINRDTHYTEITYLLTLSTERNDDDIVAFHYTGKDLDGRIVELGLELTAPDEIFPLWVRHGVEDENYDWLFVMDIPAADPSEQA